MYLFVYFLHTSMLSACRFRQGSYMTNLRVFYVLECKGLILYSFMGFYGFWSGGIVGCLLVCVRYLLMIWPFPFLIRKSKNGNSFELCSIVNSILVCRFCSSLSNSLISPHGHFQNLKRSSKCLFHDLVIFFYISLPYFLPIISYRFFS